MIYEAVYDEHAISIRAFGQFCAKACHGEDFSNLGVVDTIGIENPGKLYNYRRLLCGRYKLRKNMRIREKTLA